jgi:hypothetical protein
MSKLCILVDVILIFIDGTIIDLLQPLPQGAPRAAGTFVSEVSFNFHIDLNLNL